MNPVNPLDPILFRSEQEQALSRRAFLTRSTTGLGTIALELSGNVDVGAEKVRLGKELEKLTKAVTAGEAKLSNEAFVSKAPRAILEGARKQLDEVRGKRDEIARMIAALG